MFVFSINTTIKYNIILLTIHILDSNVAPRLTLSKTFLQPGYANVISLSCRMGGDNPSVSGNRKTTSTSFSIGFNSGLKMIYLDNHKCISLQNNIIDLQFLKHFNFTLNTGSTVSIVPKFINKLLYMSPMSHLRFNFSLLVFELFIFGFFKNFIVPSICINTLITKYSINKNNKCYQLPSFKFVLPEYEDVICQ